MDVDGLGERYIEALGEFGQLDSVADLYRLTLDDLLEMKRQADERDGTTPETVKAGQVATKWAENLIAAIDRSRKKIGRESCREGVGQFVVDTVVDEHVKKKNNHTKHTRR